MRTLLVGHALADGAPIGEALREIGERKAAADAEAGRLEESLSHLGFDPELRAMAALWPAAIRPTHARLSALPSPLIFQLPMAQTLGYLALVAFLQGAALLLLLSRILPQLEAMGAEAGADLPIQALRLAPVGLLLLVVLLPAGLILWSRHGRQTWRRHYERARQAAMAAGMAAAGAPQEARQALGAKLTALARSGAGVAELDTVAAQSLVLAEQAHHREVAAVRLLGIGGLVVIGGSVLASIYQTLAAISVPL